mgnify:CR=1 FL=1
MNFNHLLSLDRRYTKTESEIFRLRPCFPVRLSAPAASACGRSFIRATPLRVSIYPQTARWTCISSLPAIPSARLAAKPARTSKTPPNAPSKKRASSASNGRWCTSTFGACDAIAGVAARSGSPGLIPTAAIHDDSPRKFRLPCAAGAPSRRSAAAST